MNISSTLDSERYNIMVVDKITGDVVEVFQFCDTSSDRWEKVVAKHIATAYNIAGGQKTRLLSWIITNKDQKNIFYGTYSEISSESGVSVNTVNKFIPMLVKKGILKKIRYGKYMINPHIIRVGGKFKGSVVFKIWGENNK